MPTNTIQQFIETRAALAQRRDELVAELAELNQALGSEAPPAAQVKRVKKKRAGRGQLVECILAVVSKKRRSTVATIHARAKHKLGAAYSPKSVTSAISRLTTAGQLIRRNGGYIRA